MAKGILDNCTIYRVLDSLDKDTQLEKCIQGIMSYNQESNELADEKRELLNKFFGLSFNEEDTKEALNILKKLVLNTEDIRRNELGLLLTHQRMEYINGFMTLEELQASIHDLMLDDEYRIDETDYRCLLYDLLSCDPEEYSEDMINHIRNLKEDAIKKQLNPTCDYPN